MKIDVSTKTSLGRSKNALSILTNVSDFRLLFLLIVSREQKTFLVQLNTLVELETRKKKVRFRFIEQSLFHRSFETLNPPDERSMRDPTDSVKVMQRNREKIKTSKEFSAC